MTQDWPLHLRLPVIFSTVTPLKCFVVSGSGGGPHAGTHPRTLVPLFSFPPNGMLTLTVLERDLFKMAFLRSRHPQKRMSDVNSHSSGGIVNEKMPAPRFVTFKLKDTENNVVNFIQHFCL
jgi:hypothetical protein